MASSAKLFVVVLGCCCLVDSSRAETTAGGLLDFATKWSNSVSDGGWRFDYAGKIPLPYTIQEIPITLGPDVDAKLHLKFMKEPGRETFSVDGQISNEHGRHNVSVKAVCIGCPGVPSGFSLDVKTNIPGFESLKADMAWSMIGRSFGGLPASIDARAKLELNSNLLFETVVHVFSSHPLKLVVRVPPAGFNMDFELIDNRPKYSAVLNVNGERFSLDLVTGRETKLIAKSTVKCYGYDKMEMSFRESRHSVGITSTASGSNVETIQSSLDISVDRRTRTYTAQWKAQSASGPAHWAHLKLSSRAVGGPFKAKLETSFDEIKSLEVTLNVDEDVGPINMNVQWKGKGSMFVDATLSLDLSAPTIGPSLDIKTSFPGFENIRAAYTVTSEGYVPWSMGLGPLVSKGRASVNVNEKFFQYSSETTSGEGVHKSSNTIKTNVAQLGFQETVSSYRLSYYPEGVEIYSLDAQKTTDGLVEYDIFSKLTHEGDQWQWLYNGSNPVIAKLLCAVQVSPGMCGSSLQQLVNVTARSSAEVMIAELFAKGDLANLNVRLDANAGADGEPGFDCYNFIGRALSFGPTFSPTIDFAVDRIDAETHAKLCKSDPSRPYMAKLEIRRKNNVNGHKYELSVVPKLIGGKVSLVVKFDTNNKKLVNNLVMTISYGMLNGAFKFGLLYDGKKIQLDLNGGANLIELVTGGGRSRLRGRLTTPFPGFKKVDMEVKVKNEQGNIALKTKLKSGRDTLVFELGFKGRGRHESSFYLKVKPANAYKHLETDIEVSRKAGLLNGEVAVKAVVGAYKVSAKVEKNNGGNSGDVMEIELDIKGPTGYGNGDLLTYESEYCRYCKSPDQVSFESKGRYTLSGPVASSRLVRGGLITVAVGRIFNGVILLGSIKELGLW